MKGYATLAATDWKPGANQNRPGWRPLPPQLALHFAIVRIVKGLKKTTVAALGQK
jgi:hypothetical protein